MNSPKFYCFSVKHNQNLTYPIITAFQGSLQQEIFLTSKTVMYYLFGIYFLLKKSCLTVAFLVLIGLIMFGGELLTSFVPEVGVQERMREHGKDPLWKIKYARINA